MVVTAGTGEKQMDFSKQRRSSLVRLANWLAASCLMLSSPLRRAAALDEAQHREGEMKLPLPQKGGTIAVENAIASRRTVRAYRPHVLSLNQVSQLLWAAQGITDNRGYKRAVPSAGALYPMDVYAVAGKQAVARIEAGVYRYEPARHSLSPGTGGDLRSTIARAALSQMWMAAAPVNFVITAEYGRVTGKYGNRGVRYAMIEAGHIGQNLFLQAEALGLKAGIVGAFDDQKIIEIMKIPPDHEPLLIMPVGYATAV